MCSQGQQYCLKWNNHTNNMVKVFNQLLDDQNFCDVTLAVDGTQIKAHKMVLSACSTYFKDLFVANPCKHPIVILKDMRFDDLKAIINFMYCGEVNVSQNQLAALLKTAEVLKVKGLTEVNDKQTDALTVPNTSATTKPSSETSPQQTTVASGLTRKKRKRRGGNHSTNTSHSGADTENSSQSEESCDETLTGNKKTKDIDSVSRSSKESRSLLSESSVSKIISKTEGQTMNVIQTRRRQTLSHLERNETNENQSNNDCEQRLVVNNGNPSEPWPSSSEHSTALVLHSTALPTNETEDESDDMFDVKPIISFDESPNQIALREESGILSAPDDSNTSIAGTSSGQSGKICVCHLCHLTFTAYSSLRRHMARHYADRERYECEICLKSYSRKDYLKEHKKLKHAIG